MTENESKPAMEQLLVELFTTLPSYKTENNAEAVWSGLRDLEDMVVTHHQPCFLVVLSRPAVGRTTVASHCFLNSKQAGQRLFYSIDLTAHMLGMRIVASAGRIDHSRLMRGQASQRELERLASAADTLAGMPLNIIDAYAMSVSEMVADARRHAEAGKVTMVVVDGLELLGLNRSDYDGALLQLRALSRELKCIVCVTLPAGRSVDLRPNRRPFLTDIDSSDMIGTAADVIVGLYRDEMYNAETDAHGIMEIYVLKQKSGPVGRIKVQFHSAHLRLNNLAPEGV